jgi:hypothetical protein
VIDNIQPGAKVAVISENGARNQIVTFTEVARQTKTRIVLANGDTFRVVDQRRTGDYTWSFRPYLAAPESDKVQRIHRAQQIRQTVAAVEAEARKFPTDEREQAAVAGKLARLAGRLVSLTTETNGS